MRMGGASLSRGALRRARDSNVAKSRWDRAAIGEYPARTAVRTCKPTCVRHAARLRRARGASSGTDRTCDPMPEHDRAADTSRAPDECIGPLRFRQSICMTNEIDAALPLSDRDRPSRVRHHGAAHCARRVHAIAAHPVSVVAAIAPHRRRCRVPIKTHTRNTCVSCRLRGSGTHREKPPRHIALSIAARSAACLAHALREPREKPASCIARMSRIDSMRV
ncbi:hypothetical protein BSFP_056010 [Burkholderia stabilis]|uniref:Uncharacterized protein n=2 Tax=Burkholderia stabilis TaxID=95485 RepID=A0A1Y1BRV8_9BURK|nr:hypothetical protein BSFP_056010 [Burkholderia stabilis]